MGPPDAAPACADVCGDPANCKRETDEKCEEAEEGIILSVWNKVAANVANADSAFDPAALTPAATKSLKDNFNWSPGTSPADLPATVKAKLQAALTKFADNLCVKCVKCRAGDARIDQRKGVNCLQFNCYVICHGLKDDKAGAHALTHELFHRVVTQSHADELYRGQTGYPPPPTMALKMPDPYASLIDDLLPATPATSAPAPTPAPKP
jgi:hypothetical protein